MTNKFIEEETRNLVGLFQLLAKIDKRNKEKYEKKKIKLEVI